MTDRDVHHRLITSAARISPDEVTTRSFPTAFRGLAEGEVRTWLKRVAEEMHALLARERELLGIATELERRLDAPPEITEQQLLAALGDETTRVLRSAQEAADDIRRKAEERSVRIVREAQDEARLLREEVERVHATYTLEAEAAAAEVVRAAEVRAAELRADAERALADARERASRATAGEIDAGRERAREIVEEAQQVRDRLLSDLTTRRSLLLAQIEELRTGRERLVAAYRTVKRTLDEATDALAQVEARANAELAGVPRDELDGEIAGLINTPVEPEPAPRPPPPPPAPGVPSVLSSPALPTRRDLPARARPEPSPPVEPIGAGAAGGFAIAEPPADVEPVRLVPLDEPAARDVEDGAEVDAEPAGDRARDIDALFARIRAARDEALAQVDRPSAVAATLLTPPDAPSAIDEVVVDEVVDDVVPEPLAAAPGPEPEAAGTGSPVIEHLLQRRDETLEPLVVALTRKLKRALQDDQNNALDALRQQRGEPTVERLLPSGEVQVATYVGLSVEFLVDAYQAGRRAAGEEGAAEQAGEASGLAVLIEDVARSVSTPLRDRVARALREAIEVGDDEAGIVERLSSRYREWKTQRIEVLVRDGLAAAFALGAYDAVAPGVRLHWIVDDGVPCPDCDDNALESTSRGMPFPTGQVCPPAHPGCRCLALPETVITP
ncbi:MAG TPA: DivIVA domain-containing protein [Actinomycetota bacterium]|nr:DivIVA domain-containing protein [Actinomycetota bacterium]